MDRVEPSLDASDSPYKLLLEAASLVPLSHYLSALLLLSLIFLYNFLEFHFFEDLLLGFRGSPVSLTFNPSSDIYNGVVSKCRLLQGRYLATPWLSSPHFQTAFLNFFGRPPPVRYRRQLYRASDGGTIALDWLMRSDVVGGGFHMNEAISRDDATPIVVVIPGLTSDSSSSYLKHLAFNVAKHGWNIVISNHRGLGGVSITSDCFYNAGWTEDAREVINYLHHEFTRAPLFAIGTSIGANILVKYLGEDGDNLPVCGAAAISSPWDLLIGDRFIQRKIIQKLYDKALASGLLGYAQLHQPHYSRLADWDGIKKSRSIRDYDMYATCLVGKFETVDTYYRHCSSASFVGNVSVPLLSISALDDPVCTKEAIPWDESCANKNIVLAATQHGGHLAFFEGVTASSLWWVRAVIEYLSILHSSPYMHRQKKVLSSVPHSLQESSIDQGPFVSVAKDGTVAAVTSDRTNGFVKEDMHKSQEIHNRDSDEIVLDGEEDKHILQANSDSLSKTVETFDQAKSIGGTKPVVLPSNIRRCLDLLSQQNRRSAWLLAYIAIVTSLPLLGSTFHFFRKRKLKAALPGTGK